MLGTGHVREKNLAKLTAGVPMKTMGKPEDVASAILYLSSDSSSYVTGTELVIDGGILAGSSSAPKKAE